jgi:hypothetical protein
MSTGQQVLQFARPTIEALGTAGGAALGAPLGPAGIVGGAGLGYGMTQEGLRLLEEQLGYREPRTGMALATEPVRDIVEGAAFEAGGRAIVGPVLEAAGRGGLSFSAPSPTCARFPNKRLLPLPVRR